MRVTLFTSNQPRHINLANKLASIADTVYCVQECNTVSPGKVDDFFKKTPVMKEYFEKVIEAERSLFGEPTFSKPNVRTLSLKAGDINRVDAETLRLALSADVFVVFGASYIKGWLIEFLVNNNAINIHMGLSPYYRGSSCNFWAMFDNNPGYVGATIHKLSTGLDSGDMLFHCLSRPQHGENCFQFTMRSVAIAHQALASRISSGELFQMLAVKQDSNKEIRYTKNSDFSDSVAKRFLEQRLVIEDCDLDYPDLLNPFFG